MRMKLDVASKRRAMRLEGAVIALFFPALALAAQSPVRVTGGLVSGVPFAHGLEVFKGIPFAAPPVGKLRWRPPEPPAAWRGVRQADHFGAPCMQPVEPHRVGPWSASFLSMRPSSENCLYVNVWTTAKQPSAPEPVMVWIYGGGFVSGAASVRIYDPSALARRGVVLVSFNYRLGPFGFLAYPGLTQESPHHSSGNYGLLDQIAALRWVRKNIAGFGGDPREVTIFGQSAGAASVWLLMQSPLARGLFERAVIMSGPAVIPTPAMMSAKRSLAEGEAQGRKFAALLGAHSLEQLRALPAKTIVRDSGPIDWEPVEDGWVLREGWHPQREVEVINGMVADDIGIGYYGNGAPPPVTLETYRQKLEAVCGTELSTCLQLYPAHNDQQAASAILNALRDRARVSLYKWGVLQTRMSPRVYIYYFDRKIPWPQHPQFGAFHSSEEPYVFDNLRLMRRPWQALDWRIAEQMSSYWTNFAKSGSPSGASLPLWPPLRAGNLEIMQLGPRMKPMPLASSSRLKFWLGYLKTPLGF